MSVIFIGHDTTLDRKVAIKVLNEEHCHDEVRIQAFENEARLTAQVSHPNVVKIYAVGRAYGRFYLVMELLEGRSFEAIMSERGALPEGEVLEIATQVAAGLRAAKEAGMIHRDVKPGNILIDGEGRARLVDFGLALLTQNGSAQAEEIWATPFYVPPEVLARGVEDLRSDIYAFGATLYHALAGRPPFETTSTSNQVLHRAKQTIPRLCQVADWVSPRTGEVIDRMMAFKTEDRWGSYQELIQAIEKARLNTGQTPAPRIPTPHTLPSPKKRKSGGAAALGLVFSIIAIAAGLAFWKPWQSTKDGAGSLSSDPSQPPADSQKPPLFRPSVTQDEQLTQAWQSARASLTQGHFTQASEALQALSQKTKLSRKSRAWASLEASANAFLDGEPGRARRLAANSLTLIKGADGTDPDVLSLRRFAQTLRRPSLPATSDLQDPPSSLTQALGTFTIALKLWEQGRWESSLPLFANVRSASLPQDFHWFQHYQNLADTYLADGQILAKLKDLPAPQNAEEANAQIEEFTLALKKLRTKGRAIYNLRARQAYLARLRKNFQKGPTQAAALKWPDLLPILIEQGKRCHFSDIATTLADPPPDAPANAIWAWKFLEKEASAFLTELSQKRGWSAEKKDGSIVTPTSGNPQGLILGDGTLIPWSELKPQALIAQHSGPTLQAIAFAQLLGLSSVAEQKAEQLAEENPAFLRDWKRVIIGSSQ